ncbi:helix-turn-helix domain-containing protein [Clostridium sp.]|uniref:helix-turn-helix domain-containing protein n=1 Tax=Clostridium sp. TaxID=1506 RepID=UPI00345D2BEE
MFDKILRELREEKKLTQSELAKFLNVSRASISAYENRTNDPSLDVLIKMADFFNVSLDYLLGRTPEKFNNNLIPTNDADLISYLQSTIEKYKSKK